MFHSDPERTLRGPQKFNNWLSSYRQRLDRLIGENSAIGGSAESRSGATIKSSGPAISSQCSENERAGVKQTRAGAWTGPETNMDVHRWRKLLAAIRFG